MGIYFNDKLLYPKADGNEIEKKYFSEMEEISAMFKDKKTIILERDVVREWDTKKQSTKAIVPFALPTEVPVYLDTLGAVSIRYSKAPPQLVDRKLVYPTFRNFMYERMIITEKNKDLAWFILKATTFVEGGDPGNKKVIRISNPQKDILEKASEVKKIARVDALLMNDDSHVFNIVSLRQIADKFGVDIKDYETEAAGFTIREAVIEADNAKSPHFNINILLEYIEKMPKKPRVEPEEVKEEVQPEEVKEEKPLSPYVFGSELYNREELELLYPAELNPISDEFKTAKVPSVTKAKQIDLILEAKKKRV